MKNSAFTMAEVLITLGIIGVVAAMTLPTLLNNNRNKALETALKRSYSVLSQALDMYYAQNGEKLTSETVDRRELKPILMKYLNTVQDCGYGAGDVNDACVPNTGTSGNIEQENEVIYKTFNGKNNLYLNSVDDGQFVLNDGSLILLENSASGTTKMLFISVDLNGFHKLPNCLGRDLFMFQVDEKGRLLPMGMEGTQYYSKTDAYCSPTSTNNMNGAGCTYKALTDKNYFTNLH